MWPPASSSPAVRFLFSLLMAVTLATARAAEGFVTSVQPLATQAGLEALQSGGNAIDAAAAVALTLGVVDGHNSGIGGGCFFLARLKDGTLLALDGRETAPAKATRDMYLKNGKPVEELSKTGPLASATPRALAVYEEAVRKHGKLPFARAFESGIRHAETGFPIDRVYAKKLAGQATNLPYFPPPRPFFSRRMDLPISREKGLSKMIWRKVTGRWPSKGRNGFTRSLSPRRWKNTWKPWGNSHGQGF